VQKAPVNQGHVTGLEIILDTVSVSCTGALSRSLKDAGRVTSAGGARAVPAGEGSSPLLPGGSGDNVRPALRPVCGKAAGLGQAKMQVTPDDAGSQEARAGAERWRLVAAASAAVERRQACAPRWARAASADAAVGSASAGVPPPFYFYVPCPIVMTSGRSTAGFI
jgi:hypothetical protein